MSYLVDNWSMPRWKGRGIFVGEKEPWKRASLWSAVTCYRFGHRRPVAAVLRHTGLRVSPEPDIPH